MHFVFTFIELKNMSELLVSISELSVCVFLPNVKTIPSITRHTHLSIKAISISAFREVLEHVCQTADKYLKMVFFLKQF